MGWEVGGGFRIRSSYTPVADSCQCMAKPIQYCKVKIKLKKIKAQHSENGKKKKKEKTLEHIQEYKIATDIV